MRTDYLFPTACKKLGWCVLAVSAVLYVVYVLWLSDWAGNVRLPGGVVNYSGWWDEAAYCGMAVGLLLVAFARERDEDECIAQLRLRALVWSVKMSTLAFVLLQLLVYDDAFLYVMSFYWALVFVCFIPRFHVALRKFRREGHDE